MLVYDAGEYAAVPVLFVSHLTDEEVTDILRLVSGLIDDRIKSISLRSALYADNQLRVSTCARYEEMFGRSSTCVAGPDSYLQRNPLAEWAPVPIPPDSWGMQSGNATFESGRSTGE